MTMKLSRTGHPGLVLDVHGVGIGCLLASDAFKAGQYSAIVVLIALHGEAAFFVSVSPGDADKMLLGFAERHECAETEGDNCKPDGCAYAPVDILPVGNVSDLVSWDSYEFLLALIFLTRILMNFLRSRALRNCRPLRPAMNLRHT